MNKETATLQMEDRLFSALSRGNREALEGIVADDCLLIDVLTGSEVPRPDFIHLIGSRGLVFDSIERLDAHVRLYGGTSIVTGQTRMIGRFNNQAFQVHSRYTHVYVQDRDGLRLANAQGTPIVTGGLS